MVLCQSWSETSSGGSRSVWCHDPYWPKDAKPEFGFLSFDLWCRYLCDPCRYLCRGESHVSCRRSSRLDESNRKLLAAASYRCWTVQIREKRKKNEDKIERNQKEKSLKRKKERVVSVGKHRKMVLALWLYYLVVLLLAFIKISPPLINIQLMKKWLLKRK